MIDFLIAVATIPNKNNLGEDGVILVHSLREDSPSWVGGWGWCKSGNGTWLQELEASGHIVSIVREQQNVLKEALIFSFLFSPDLQPIEQCFPTQSSQSTDSLTDILK